VFKGLAYAPEKIGWILNRYERGSEVGTQDIERTLGVQTLRLVANAYRDVSASVSSSTPVLELARSSLVTRHLAELARSLSPRSPERRSLIGRLFQRA
jgi:Flp pilus assembly CpaE family ATPase